MLWNTKGKPANVGEFSLGINDYIFPYCPKGVGEKGILSFNSEIFCSNSVKYHSFTFRCNSWELFAASFCQRSVTTNKTRMVLLYTSSQINPYWLSKHDKRGSSHISITTYKYMFRGAEITIISLLPICFRVHLLHTVIQVTLGNCNGHGWIMGMDWQYYEWNVIYLEAAGPLYPYDRFCVRL